MGERNLRAQERPKSDPRAAHKNVYKKSKSGPIGWADRMGLRTILAGWAIVKATATRNVWSLPVAIGMAQ